MSRPVRISLIAIASLLVLALIVVIGGIEVLRSDWFFQQVRQRLIAEMEKSTGGKIELRELHFDWKTLIAEADGLVIHGTEPPGEAPLLRAAKVTIGLKLISLEKQQIDVASVDIAGPQVNLLIAADGRTNIPEPKTPASTKSIDQTILDLAVGRFRVEDGIVQIKAAGMPPRKLPWSMRAEKLKAQLTYAPKDAAGGPSYSGDISMQPLSAGFGNYGPIDAAVELAVKLERDHIQVNNGSVHTTSSQIEFSGDLRDLKSPEISGKYRARVAAQEAGRLLSWRTTQSGIIDSSGDFRLNNAGDFLVKGKLEGVDLTYRDPDLHFDHVRIVSNFSADPKKLELTNMSASLLGGRVQGRVTVTNGDRFDIKGSLVGFGATALANLLHTTPPPFDALIAGPFEARGSITGVKYRRVDASAQLTLSPAGTSPVSGFIDARYDGARQYVDLAKSFLALPNSRVDFSGGLGVQPGAYDAQLAVRLASTNLNDVLIFAPEVKELPVSLQNGHAEFTGSITGPPTSPVIAGHVTANNIVIEKQKVEAFSADVNARSTEVQVHNGTLAYQDMRARLSGTLALDQWKPDNRSAVTATASLQNADIANMLALLGQTQIPVKGSISAEAQVNGTLADPRATATLRGGKGSAYGEPFDRATANLTYVNGGRQEFTAEVDSGVKKINLTGAFQHSPTDFLTGTIQANIKTSDIALNQIQAIREYQPTIGGITRATADTEVRLIDSKAGEQFEIVTLNADIVTRNLAVEQKQLGDLHLTAHTASGQNPPLVNVQIESNLAHSVVRGNGSWRLAGDYSGEGAVTFSQVNLADVRKLFAPHATSLASIGGSVEGKITFRGSAEKPRAMTGALEIPKLEIIPEPGGDIPIPESLRDLVIRNAGPIRATMGNGNIRIESARVTARSTDVSLEGTINLNATAPLNLRASGNLDLSILPMFERDLVSSGTVAATATIRGGFAQPEILGRLDVKNANLNLEGLPNGLSNANGTVIFDPSRATIQSLTAETGGGKVNLTGFASFSNGPMALRLEADAKEVRVRYPEGVSTVANASLRLIGTTERSTLSGTITVVRSAFTPHTDLGRMLASASAPVQTPAVQTGLVGNMQFDVDILTAPDATFQTSLAQGLEADASLRLRGTVTNPVLLGRVNVNQGELMFFGNKYTINEGTISFFNPVKLEPILDVSLETRARGVDVTINVTGPITKLNVSYRSDPPLQFSDLVALLATGRTPENPTIAENYPGTTQTWQEMGASALLGQAIANPLAGRLQRFFGVSKIKIDPLLTGVAGNAQARLTIEQNITPDLTFTYITNVASSTGSAQVIRVEWDFSRHWSAVAVRDEYGYFGIDFQYRKRFK
jgi:translocation and assembly module TamB